MSPQGHWKLLQIGEMRGGDEFRSLQAEKKNPHDRAYHLTCFFFLLKKSGSGGFSVLTSLNHYYYIVQHIMGIVRLLECAYIG